MPGARRPEGITQWVGQGRTSWSKKGQRSFHASMSTEAEVQWWRDKRGTVRKLPLDGGELQLWIHTLADRDPLRYSGPAGLQLFLPQVHPWCFRTMNERRSAVEQLSTYMPCAITCHAVHREKQLLSSLASLLQQRPDI